MPRRRVGERDARSPARRRGSRHDPWKAGRVVVDWSAFRMRLRGSFVLLRRPLPRRVSGELHPCPILDPLASGRPPPRRCAAVRAHAGLGTTTDGSTSAASGGGGIPRAAARCRPPQLLVPVPLRRQPATCTPGPGRQTARGPAPASGAPPASGHDGETPGQLSCQVVAAGDGGVAAACARPARPAKTPVPAATDCQAGSGAPLAPDVSGLPPYCCDSLESCQAGTYCAPRHGGAAEARDPGVHRGIPCDLLQRASCPERGGVPPSSVIRHDELHDPRPGHDQQTVPRAAGYTCSCADGICVELCRRHQGRRCGPNGYCRGRRRLYPTGVGILPVVVARAAG